MIDEEQARRHLSNIQQHKNHSKQNAQIYYKNKGESLLNSYGLNINANQFFNVNEAKEGNKLAKPPKHPGVQKPPVPQNLKTDDETNEETKLAYYEQILESDDSPTNQERLKQKWNGNPFNLRPIKSEIIETESESSTLVRADSETDGNQLAQEQVKDLFSKEEIDRINQDAKEIIQNAKDSICNDRERFSEKLQKFKFDRSSSPANIQANEMMNDLIRFKKTNGVAELHERNRNSQNNHPNISPSSILNKEREINSLFEMDYLKNEQNRQAILLLEGINKDHKFIHEMPNLENKGINQEFCNEIKHHIQQRK